MNLYHGNFEIGKSQMLKQEKDSHHLTMEVFFTGTILYAD